jgi:predicted metal-dependent HD superfamily phosphohydrolase
MSIDASDTGNGEQAAAELDRTLRDRFSALWRRYAVNGDPSGAGQIYEILRGHYCEPHRRYHDLNHLAACLEQFDLAADQIAHPERVELAIWFHDVINVPGARDNEPRSANLFLDLAGDDTPGELNDNVVRLILATTHTEVPDAIDERWICDIDLTSFGCPWECYMRDTNNLKAEFPGTEAEYFRRQRPFLEGLRNRPRIFTTDFFNARYEQRARENISGLLDSLDNGRAP